MTRTVLNSGFSPTGVRPPVPSMALGGVPRLKYVRMRTALAAVPADVADVLRAAPVVGGYRWTLVDVKPARLVAGEVPCVPGWHIDASPSQEGEASDTHHLIVFGGNALTEFIAGPVALDCPSDAASVARAVRKASGPTVRVPEGEFVTYGREGVHRGVPAEFTGERLLVRVTETNHVRPRSVR